MTLQDAYRIVYNDILNKDVGLLVGRYDARNGGTEYMHGIATVMEFIAINVSEADCDDFENIFYNNMLESRERAEKR